MSNAASTPEFRRILQSLYDSGRYRKSGEVLREAWKEYKKRHGETGSTQQRRYAMRKTAMGMNPRIKYLRSFINVSFSANEIRNFKSQWPGSRLKERSTTFQFQKSNGDLVDLWGQKNYDGPDLVALFQDAKAIILKNPHVTKNPGAQWHERQARIGETLSEKSPRAKHSARSYYHGYSDAHQFSAIASKQGINPRKRKRWRHPVSERQRRWAFAAEKRGELKRGTARKWSRRVKRRKNPIAVYNPKVRLTKLPASQIEIRYKRTGGKYAGKWFKHEFKSSIALLGMSDGNILLKSLSGKRLWGSVD